MSDSAVNPPAPPAAYFGSDKKIRIKNGSIQFTDSSTNSPASWSWNFGDGNTSTVQNPTHSYSATGSYSVSLTTNANSTFTRSGYIIVDSAKVVINDPYWSTHGQYIQQAIQLSYPALTSITHYWYSYPTVLAIAKECGANEVIQCTSGMYSYKAQMAAYAHYGIFSIVPSGANTFTHITQWGDSTQFSTCGAVPCGAGYATQNLVSYPCDFYDDDIDGNNATNEESFSTGRIAGKILFVRDSLNCSMWEAIYRCAVTASAGGAWYLPSGYGKINTTSAINYGGSIPASPY